MNTSVESQEVRNDMSKFRVSTKNGPQEVDAECVTISTDGSLLLGEFQSSGYFRAIAAFAHGEWTQVIPVS